MQYALSKEGEHPWGVLVSPQLTNEDLFVIRSLFKEKLGIACDGRVPDREGYSDSFLIMADKNPNRRGMEALGLAVSEESALPLVERSLAGEIKALYVFGHDLALLYGEEALKRLAQKTLLIYQGTNENGTSRLAHLVLPSAVYAEKDGTFVNCQGRVQRIVKAFEPLKDSRADTAIVGELARRLARPLPFQEPPEIFSAIAGEVPAFHGMCYDALKKQGSCLLRETVPL